MESKKLPPSKRKALATIRELDRIDLAANAEGILRILNATSEEERFSSFVTYGSLLSLKGKANKNRLLYLFHQGYVSRFYENGDYYFRLTERGEEEAERYLGKPHGKKPIPRKKNIDCYIPINGKGE